MEFAERLHNSNKFRQLVGELPAIAMDSGKVLTYHLRVSPPKWGIFATREKIVEGWCPFCTIPTCGIHSLPHIFIPLEKHFLLWIWWKKARSEFTVDGLTTVDFAYLGSGCMCVCLGCKYNFSYFTYHVRKLMFHPFLQLTMLFPGWIFSCVHFPKPIRK